jgi:hypothetical protein
MPSSALDVEPNGDFTPIVGQPESMIYSGWISPVMSRSDLIGSYSERPRCPHCGDRIDLEGLRIFVKPSDPHQRCPTCGRPIRVSVIYQRSVILIDFALAWLIPYLMGIRAYVVVAWIPFFLLASMLVPNIAKVTIPPKLEDPELAPQRSVLRRNIELFIVLWLGWALFILFNGILMSLEDKGMFFAYLSGPLAWFDSAFVVRSDTKSILMFDIFLANTFVGAVFLFPISILFRTIFRGNRVTRLGIDDTARVEDDDKS